MLAAGGNLRDLLRANTELTGYEKAMLADKWGGAGEGPGVPAVSGIETYPDIVGRDPIPKIQVKALTDAHPGWSDEQVADRINREYESPVINAEEVAYWRTEAVR